MHQQCKSADEVTHLLLFTFQHLQFSESWPTSFEGIGPYI